MRLGRDSRLLVAGQAVRAFGYGFTAVLLGALLAARGYGHLRAGALLTCLIGGTALSSLVVGAVADRVGRRRCYAGVFALVALAGALVALDAPYPVLLAVALTGALSTDVVDNGPATTLEQAMLAGDDAGTARVFGVYNAAGASAGALGALAQAIPGVDPHHAALFLLLVPVGLVGIGLSLALSPAVESVASAGGTLGPVPVVVRRMAALFAVDAAGGGLVTTAFLSYLMSERYGTSVASLGVLFFAIAIVQAVAVTIAPRLARRFGLVATMVGTHLPSNVLLACVAFAPSFPVAAGLLLLRTTLAQMDVPTRQALVMSVVTPEHRVRAAAVTNAARYTVRPVGPVAAGALQQLWLGAPLLVAGVVKGSYDLALWRWARRAGLSRRSPASESCGEALLTHV